MKVIGPRDPRRKTPLWRMFDLAAFIAAGATFITRNVQFHHAALASGVAKRHVPSVPAICSNHASMPITTGVFLAF